MRWWTLLALAPVVLGDAPLAAYLEARANDSLLCVYLFNASAPFTSLLADCPFGDLAPTAATALSPRHGVYLRSMSSPQDAQLVSQSPAKASTIYPMAIGKGMTFELVARVYKPVPANVNVNLFALASSFDDCTNPGIRLEVSDRQLLVLIFYSLQATPGGTTMVCYEESFYSMTEADGACQIPVGTRDAPPPFVHLFASIVPDGGASWTTRFFISFVDATGMHTCSSHNSMGGSTAPADLTSVTGAYTLYVGNNAREPRARPPSRATRQFQGSTPPPTLPPTVLSLLQKGQDRLELLLPSSGGVFFSINGKKVVDVDHDGIAFGNNGTKYGLPQLTRLVSTAMDALGPTSALFKQKKATLAAIANTTSRIDWAKHPTHARYPPPNASAHMDVFFFAMAAVPMDAETLLARSDLSLPHLGLGRNRTLHTAQDTSTLLRLTEAMWNDPAAAIRLTATPVRGTLQSCGEPRKNLSAGDVVVDPCVAFVPPPGLSNANMPLHNKYMVSQRRDPFATVTYELAQQPFSTSTVLEFFVDAAPAPAPTPKTAPTIVLVSPPYAIASNARYHGDAYFSMHLLSNAEATTSYRATLSSASNGGALRSHADGLSSPTARMYCPFTPNLTALCLARDRDSDGVVYELHGERQSPTRLVFRGSLDQVRRALSNVSLTNWRHSPHSASVRFELQALTSLEMLVARTLVVHFTNGETTLPTTVCSNLFGFLPLCTESFGNGAVLGTLSLMALTTCVCRRLSKTQQAARKKCQATYQVATQDEFTGILDQLVRIMLEPSLEGPTLLWRACRYGPEQSLCLETLVVVLSLQQALPAFLAHLRNDPDTADDVALHARFFCKFMGRDWFNRVLAHANGVVTTTFTEAFLHCVRQNLHSLPVEIRVLADSIAPVHVVVVDWFLLPGLSVVAGDDDAHAIRDCMNVLEHGSADARDAQYIPESKEPMLLHRDLLAHVLRHLHCLCAHHMHTMAKTTGAVILDDEDVPPTGQRIRDVVLALGPISISLPGLLALTKAGPLVHHP
ncbi:hypothetical protein SPRG_13323 [Saprolegnia parasitica CBS 223.65]|uniref:Uncharacterized protein n=2 Tax=Saprolegnia parasitica (strain CBS 223.65) TaxID=695850 RepID=A0A067C2H6_SAPPC|nr:hypothetical protein SPRG_13323 [Saprolegnia parasitica CBS 223.65]KDO20741.1 hypothetical protein SPRG_13323 [Saprolegnia parasitica CBS 223.65]|eukprot:XP_012208553.1 hypothetical protein SPRG_13323 [Saprolegnia parasitica CBS 223.65]